jgi:hypothetical protein
MVERPKVAPREIRTLSIDEAQRFLAAAVADRFEALWSSS